MGSTCVAMEVISLDCPADGDSDGRRRGASIATAGGEAFPGAAELRAEGDQQPSEGGG
jgi:hypothetical protein